MTVAVGAGRVFVGGRAHTAPGQGRRWFVRAYDLRTGVLLWQDEVASGVLCAGPLDRRRANRAIAARTFTSQVSPSNEDRLIRTYDARTGRLVWQDLVDKGVSENEEVFNVAASQGRVFVAGDGGATCRVIVLHPNNCDGFLRAYDVRSGRFLWEHRFAEAPADRFTSVDARGNRVFVAGWGGNDCDFSGRPTNYDMILRAFDTGTGHVVWEDRADMAGTDEPGDGLAVHGGRVFVSGSVYDGSDLFRTDIVLRAYHAGVDGGDNEDDNKRDSVAGRSRTTEKVLKWFDLPRQTEELRRRAETLGCDPSWHHREDAQSGGEQSGRCRR